MAARTLARELAQPPCDFGLHVERLLTLSDPARVARLDELTDLFGEPRIHRWTRQRGHLRVDVQRLLALSDPARVAGLEHLPDLRRRDDRRHRDDDHEDDPERVLHAPIVPGRMVVDAQFLLGTLSFRTAID